MVSASATTSPQYSPRIPRKRPIVHPMSQLGSHIGPILTRKTGTANVAARLNVLRHLAVSCSFCSEASCESAAERDEMGRNESVGKTCAIESMIMRRVMSVGEWVNAISV